MISRRSLVRRTVLFAIVALPGSVQAQSLPALDAPAAASLPALAQPLNIQVDPLLQPLVDKLLRQSATVRRQWQAIGASRLVRVSLVSSPLLRESSAARARTEVSRYAHGAIRAVVELPSVVDITELLPHELEHVLEQVEGLDLPRAGEGRLVGRARTVARGLRNGPRPERRVRRDAGGLRRDRPGVLGGPARRPAGVQGPASRRTSRRRRGARARRRAPPEAPPGGSGRPSRS